MNSELFVFVKLIHSDSACCNIFSLNPALIDNYKEHYAFNVYIDINISNRSGLLVPVFSHSDIEIPGYTKIALEEFLEISIIFRVNRAFFPSTIIRILSLDDEDLSDEVTCHFVTSKISTTNLSVDEAISIAEKDANKVNSLGRLEQMKYILSFERFSA